MNVIFREVIRTASEGAITRLVGRYAGPMWWRSHDTSTESVPLTWEYKVANLPATHMERELNLLGRDGWELVATLAATDRMILKRPAS